jgi:hypothetical protein
MRRVDCVVVLLVVMVVLLVVMVFLGRPNPHTVTYLY